MIKILFYIEKFAYNGSIGGAEKALINLVNHMDPKVFDITVQTLYPDGFSRSLGEHIRYKYCYQKKNGFSDLIYRAEAETGLTYRLHIKGDYDIEIAFLEYDTTKIIAASTNRRAKKVAWVHCDLNIAVQNKQKFVSKTARQYEKFDQIVCVSQQCRNSFITLFGNGYDPVVLPNVIDTEEVLSKSEEPLPEGIQKKKLTVCSVGRFSPPKNHLRMLRACKRLKDKGYDFELWLVGDGALRPQIEAFIHENNLSDTVKLWGFQSNPYPFMRESDLLICSSNYEGYSTFITEGLILQKRIITTECSGMHELLDNYSAGRIVANNDKAFYDGLVEFFILPETLSEPEGYKLSTEKLVEENELFFKALYLQI